MPRLAICSRDLHWQWINWAPLYDTMEVSMLRLTWLTVAQHVFQPALTGRLELISRKIVSCEPGTKAIAVSRFREKLSPANWVQGVTAISRKISRSWAPKKWGPTCDRDISNSAIYATAIYRAYTVLVMQHFYIGAHVNLQTIFPSISISIIDETLLSSYWEFLFRSNKASLYSWIQLYLTQHVLELTYIILGQMVMRLSIFIMGIPTLIRRHICIMRALMYSVECIFNRILTHWGRDKMAAVFQTTFSNAFSWMKMYEYWLKFHWSLFLRVQLTISHHWFR